MNIDSLVSTTTQGSGQSSLSKGADMVAAARRQKNDIAVGDSSQQQQIQPEELLSQINALTENGVYSVRFEADSPGGGMVVKVVDRQTDEVIRQIPSEELLSLTRRLNDLRGNLLHTEG